MKTDIRERVRSLSNNVELLYQMLDRKIAILVQHLGEIPDHEE